jgi:hypothetical protein
MIHSIQNSIQALEVLFQGFYVPEGPCRCPVFDLDDSVIPDDISVALYECETCDLTVHLNLGDDPISECPRCREILKLVSLAEMVVQGAVVLWRAE